MTVVADGGKRVVIVAGPTCSGKSLLAMMLAERMAGTVINADSMQIYRELRIVTARPSADDEARVPHALYGVRPAAEPGSAAWWRQAALSAIADAHAAGRLPILCGGTGLYFAALTQGLAEIPDPGTAARQEARALLAELGSVALHARLADVDPATAAGLRPGDSQRVARAWEVWRGTGRGMAAWHEAQAVASSDAPMAGLDFRAILIDPPRDDLRAAIAGRSGAMIAAGATEEVAALLAKRLDPALPAMRAHGVPELAAYLRGELSLAQAEAKACLVTQQYTKRQSTWFRHRTLAPPEQSKQIVARVTALEQLSCSQMADMQNFILAPVDAVQHGP